MIDFGLPLKFPPKEFTLLVRAWSLLIAGTILQRAVPMTWWGRLMGTPVAVSVSVPVASSGPKNAHFGHMDVKNAIHRASRKLPWTPTCLAQAFAGQRILLSRKTAGEVFIGLKPEGDTDWPTHAWLTHQGETLTGELEEKNYFPATVYRVLGQPGHRIGTTLTER